MDPRNITGYKRNTMLTFSFKKSVFKWNGQFLKDAKQKPSQEVGDMNSSKSIKEMCTQTLRIKKTPGLDNITNKF